MRKLLIITFLILLTPTIFADEIAVDFGVAHPLRFRGKVAGGVSYKKGSHRFIFNLGSDLYNTNTQNLLYNFINGDGSEKFESGFLVGIQRGKFQEEGGFTSSLITSKNSSFNGFIGVMINFKLWENETFKIQQNNIISFGLQHSVALIFKF
jgi:hypothetical protein